MGGVSKILGVGGAKKTAAAAPKPVAPPPKPVAAVDTGAMQDAQAMTRKNERRAKGAAATMLTGSQGYTSTETKVGTKKLLGG